MPFILRVEGFGKIEEYEVYSTYTVMEIKLRFCSAIKRSVTSVVPFINSRLLFESHTLEEAHVTEATPIKMYDTEMAKLILNTAYIEEPRMKIEKKSSAAGDPNHGNVQPMGRLRPWSEDDGKPKKGGLGLF
jgi:hypothetical protein